MFANGIVTRLGVLSDTVFGVATAINELNQAVGYSTSFDGATQALLFANGTVTVLGQLPGGAYSVATGINNQGQIVGTAQLPSGDMRAVMFENGVAISLGTLPGGSNSAASGINNFGQVVGNSDGQAALFQNGTVEALPNLPNLSADEPVFFSGASAINDRGQIVGFDSYSPQGGLVHPVIWALAAQFGAPMPGHP
jgi:probable HAF family extracellular repeat protein